VDSVVSGTTVVDISGTGNNGTFNGNASYSSTDRAFTFDGSGDRITTTAPFSVGDNTFSVSLWVKRNANGGTYCPIYIGDAASGQGIGMDIYTNGSVYWFIYNGKNFLWSGVTGNWFPVGSWTHVVASHTDGTDFANLNKVWINGVEMSGSATFGGTSDLYLDTNDGVTLGARVNNNYLNGQISNFKLYDVALTAEEVAMEYALGRTGKSLNLTDTSLCLGGTVPRAQFDVRGGARFEQVRVGSDVDITHTQPTNPRSVLHVSGDELFQNTVVIDCTATNSWNASYGGGIMFRQGWYNATPTQMVSTGGIYGTKTVGNGGYGGSLAFYTQNGVDYTEKMRIRHDGNVGIGTTSPGYELSVYDDTNTPIQMEISGNTNGYTSTSMVLKDRHNHPSARGMLIIYHRQNNTQWSHGPMYSSSNFGFKYNSSTTSYDTDSRTSTNLVAYLSSSTNVGAIDFTGQHRNFIDGVPYTEYDSLEGLIVSANKNKYFDIDEDLTTGANAIQISQSLPLVSLSTKEKDKACFGVISGSEDPEKREYSQGSFVSVVQKQKGDKRAFINSVGEGAMWVVNTGGALESGDYITTSNVAGYGQGQDDDILHNYTVAKITMDCDFNPPDIPVQRILKELSNITYWFQLEDATSNAHDRTVEETYYTTDRHVEVYGHVDEQSNVFVPPEHDVELYVKTQVNTVSEEVWAALPEDERVLYDANTFTYTQTIEIAPEVWDDLGVEEQNTYAHGYFNVVTDEVAVDTPGAVERTRTVYKNVINDTKVEPETPEDYLSEVREEWVNVLDEHGQLQWEDVPWGDTEPAYKLRYLDAEGQITTRHNAVHIAAFVGVTYHCG
jgi:hypothetical protein